MGIHVQYRAEMLLVAGLAIGILLSAFVALVVYDYVKYHKKTAQSSFDSVASFLQELENNPNVVNKVAGVSNEALVTYLKDVATAINEANYEQENYDYIVLCIHRQLRSEVINKLSPVSKYFIRTTISRNKANFIDEF